MKIVVKEMRRCTLVTVSGIIDSGTAPDLEKALLGIIARAPVIPYPQTETQREAYRQATAPFRNIVVNLAEVDFISSAGIKALLSGYVKTRKAVPAGDLVISEIKPEIKESLDLVGFDQLFKFYERDVDAVGSF